MWQEKIYNKDCYKSFDDGIDVVISNNKIAINGDLTVRFSYKDKREFRYIKGMRKLEIYEDGQWTEMKK